MLQSAIIGSATTKTKTTSARTGATLDNGTERSRLLRGMYRDGKMLLDWPTSEGHRNAETPAHPDDESDIEDDLAI